MHHHAAGLTADDILNVAANLAIVGGYVIIPFTASRMMPLTVPVRIAGIGFFLLCATTHIAMAFDWDHRHPCMLAVHVVQAVSVWVFVLGLARILAAARRFQRGGE